MTTITITGKQPGKTDVTISSTVNPAVKTVVPVTVLSRNLLSYGPASGNGLTATVSLLLNVISAEATPTAKVGDLRIQLESGTTAHDWMRPDNTSLRGGMN